MKIVAPVLALLIAAGGCSFCSAADPACSADAISRAQQLLTFHAGADERATIEKTAKQLPSIRNPADTSQKLDVLEVWGNIYKGRYRMRFIYYNSASTHCLLMGEEILEFARL
jgi:hypothetical protein